MKNIILGFRGLIVAVFALACFSVFGMTVRAEDASVALGSGSYEATAGDESFPVGIHVNADGAVGLYHIVVNYDAAHLQYVSGATSAQNGQLIIEGLGDGTKAKVFLYFKGVNAGDASIAVAEAQVYRAGDNMPYSVTSLGSAPVVVKAGVLDNDVTDDEDNQDAQIDDNAGDNGDDNDDEDAANDQDAIDDNEDDDSADDISDDDVIDETVVDTGQDDTIEDVDSADDVIVDDAIDNVAEVVNDDESSENGELSAAEIYELSKNQEVIDDRGDLKIMYIVFVVVLVILLAIVAIVIRADMAKNGLTNNKAAKPAANNDDDEDEEDTTEFDEEEIGDYESDDDDDYDDEDESEDSDED